MSLILPLLATYSDPLKKREEFAVNLRKKKTTDIIQAKRRRLIGAYQEEVSQEGVTTSYKGYAEFEKNITDYEQNLKVLCPEIFNDAKHQPMVRKLSS